ncbi:MAG TPA: glycosyl hydrolase family 18 protein, partial [Candidatus Limnocylindrales bacterium]|nr:glycosyl hydrolase family 18 protein [Candidatus Limnocylindrales bacterium]
VALSILALLPAPAIAAAPARGSDTIRPTIHYEEALAHAHDTTRFTAGDRVTVPFRPRAGDRWKVGGRTPQVLPAGRRSGAAMRQEPAEPAPAPRPLVDQPTVDPADVIAADASGWSATEATVVEPAAVVSSGGLRREVFGFLPYWELTDTSTRLDWSKLSTIAYFGVGADRNGNLVKRNSDGSTTVGWSGWTSSKMTSVINAAHQNRTRVVLTVQSFAWSTSGKATQAALLGDSVARSRLAYTIAAAVRDRGADGVNLDFEPIVSGYGDEFTALVRKVRFALDQISPGYQLTFDTTGYIGNYPIEDATAPGGADAIFIMGYDYRSSTSNPVGSIAPLGGSRYDIRETVAAYLARVPASKLILGVPYYGRAWSTETSALNAKNISGAKYGASTTVLYETARSYAAQYGRRYDSTEGVAWTVYRRQNCTKTYGCLNPWRQIYYDDATALRAKYDLVNRYDLRGAGIWALGYDGTRTELYQAIADRFVADTIPPKITGAALSAARFSPNGDGVIDTTTARLTVSGLTTWGYRVYPVVGTTLGAAIRSGSRVGTAPAMTWDGRNADRALVPDGSYRIILWAEDASGNHAERAFGVVVDTHSPTVSPRVSRGFISPDGDGVADILPLRWSSTETIAGAVRLRSASGALVRGWSFGSRSTWSTTWDGRDRTGAITRDGRYMFQVDGRDAAGNRVVATAPFLIDRTIRSVRWSDSSFDPRARQTSQAKIVLRRPATITTAIYHGTTLVRRVWTNKALAAGNYYWTWNGKTAAGAYVAPGTYRMLVTAMSWIGTTTYSRSVTVERH